MALKLYHFLLDATNGELSDSESIGNAVEEPSSENAESTELVILDPNATEVDLNHGRIAKLENLECLTQVEGLYLRWNLIKKIENIEMLVTLRELELYDNQITVIENLSTLVNLE